MPHPKVKIADNSGNEVGVTSNALDVNIAGGSSIDIGDVDIHLSGNVPLLGGAGDVAAGVLRVTIADNDPHWGEVGAAADHDGVAHAQLKFIGNSLSPLSSILTYTNTAQTVLSFAASTTGGQYAEGDGGFLATGVRNDTLASLVSVDHDHAPFQVNASGALYVTGESRQNIAVTDYGFGIMGEAKTIDGSTLPNLVGEGSAARLAMSRAGIAFTCLTDDAGASDLGTTITTHLSEIEGAVETIEGAVSGSEMQVDIVSSATLTVDGSGVTQPVSGTVTANLGTTDNAVLDAIASSLEILDDWDDSNYANVNINLAGSDAPTGGGAESGALRVTLANDSTGVISIDDGGNTITVDGTVSVNSHAVTNAGTFATQIDGDALTALQLIDDTVATLGTTTYSETSTKGTVIGAVRNDTLATLADTDNEIAPLQVDASGALYVRMDWDVDQVVQGVAGTYNISDRMLQVSSTVRSDTLAALGNVADGDWTELQVDAQGALYTTHGMTGMVSDGNATISDTTAEQLDGSTSGLDVACKRVDLMATHFNTGYIWVGDSGVTNNGNGGGIRLGPGDFYSIDVNNLNDIWVIATVDEENITYMYFT